MSAAVIGRPVDRAAGDVDAGSDPEGAAHSPACRGGTGQCVCGVRGGSIILTHCRELVSPRPGKSEWKGVMKRQSSCLRRRGGREGERQAGVMGSGAGREGGRKAGGGRKRRGRKGGRERGSRGRSWEAEQREGEKGGRGEGSSFVVRGEQLGLFYCFV